MRLRHTDQAINDDLPGRYGLREFDERGGWHTQGASSCA